LSRRQAFVAPGNPANLVRPFDSPCYLSREHFTGHRCKKVPEPAVEEEKEGEEEAAAEGDEEEAEE
jgi:hypothetical protein